jgi:hypothetical protein
MYEELEDHAFTVISVALDKSPEDARPYIEKARPRHPSLIDPEHRVARLYGIINVSTVIWIDEQGRIVRPNAIEYGSDIFKEFHGQEAAPHLNALRAWVKDGKLPFGPDQVRARQMLPTADEQLARAEFALAWHLHQSGKTEAAERHFEQAGQLSPFDWTIRRGSMPIRGMNPMGPDFFEIYKEWEVAGKPSYHTFAVGNSRR